jgi:hypothetical protein
VTKEERLQRVATEAVHLCAQYEAEWRESLCRLSPAFGGAIVAAFARLSKVIEETRLEVEDLHP